MDWECRDIVVYGDDGVAVYRGPRFLRCSRQAECGALITHGLLKKLKRCVCGNIRFNAALRVKPEEQDKILMGEVPLLEWERAMIEGTLKEIKTNDAASAT